MNNAVSHRTEPLVEARISRTHQRCLIRYVTYVRTLASQQDMLGGVSDDATGRGRGRLKLDNIRHGGRRGGQPDDLYAIGRSTL